MSKTLAQLNKEIAALTREAEKVKRKEVEGVIARIKEAIATYGLTATDLGLSRGTRVPKAAAKKAAPARGRKRGGGDAKFRDEAGNVWGGRGPRPRWLRDALAAGKELSDFAVN